MANNGKPSPLLPSPSSPPSPLPLPPSLTLAIPAQLDVPPHESKEQMQPQPAMVALARRPRGRPPSSTNKPKLALKFPIPATFLLQEKEDFLKPIVLNIPAGMDIINAIIDFACNRDVSIVVHNASGPISAVTLCNLFDHSHDLLLQGNFHMLSLLGFYTKSLSPSPPFNVPYSSFTIQVSRTRDPKLVGGLIGGKVIAMEPVQKFVVWISDCLATDSDFVARVFDFIWVLWKRRNTWVFSQQETPILQIFSMNASFSNYLEPPKQSPASTSMCWKPPDPNDIQVNLDALGRREVGTGMDAIFRDHLGQPLATPPQFYPICYEPMIAEILAFKRCIGSTRVLNIPLLRQIAKFFSIPGLVSTERTNHITRCCYRSVQV
ncbi:AT-hook motif nuclear-localized protein 17 [Spatholobus suberectus]|nr:AT-hook motif nuclear-localized protein 17 [Spatholobus suberectus]